MNPKEITRTLAEHLKYLADPSTGRRAHLAGTNLSEANLSGVNLFDANLSKANLSKANLSKANLSEANLSGANLSEANLSEANLLGTNLSEANLLDANLSQAYLSGANLFGADLGDFRLLRIGPVGSRRVYLTIKRGPNLDEVMTDRFRGTLAEFEAEVSQTHGDNELGHAYQAIIANVRQMWT